MSTAIPGATARVECDSESLTEYIDGVEVELPPMSVEAQESANDLSRSIANFSEAAGLGKAYAEMLIDLGLPGRGRERRPDVIYVPFAKWPKGTRRVRNRSWKIVPDICVEVVSPTDKYYDLEEKIAEYFEAGVPQAWIVSPLSRTVQIYRGPASLALFTGRDVLTCPEILPGFELSLAEFFG